MTSFPYRPIRVRRVGIHWRPFATVILFHKGRSIELDVLVDSGVGLQVGAFHLSARIAWALAEVTPVLGRLDVFDQLSVVFDRKRKRVIFTRS